MTIIGNTRNSLAAAAAFIFVLFATSTGAAPLACNGPGMHLADDLKTLKPQLRLTEAQSALWQKAEDAANAARQEFKSRRAQQAAAKDLPSPGDDPRAFAARMDREMAAGMETMKAVREQWFLLHDALDSSQKAKAREFMHARMEEKRAGMQKHMAGKPAHGDCGPGTPPPMSMQPFFPPF